MSNRIFSGYGEPQTFTVKGKQVKACCLAEMVMKNKGVFDGVFPEGIRPPLTKDFIQDNEVLHWYMIKTDRKGIMQIELYKGILPKDNNGYPFIRETELNKYLKRVN